MRRGQEKVVSVSDLAVLVQRLKASGRRVVMCHGCFDILHYGHLRHFEAARALGDVLVVTVTADEFVNKGSNRPVFPDVQRAELVGGIAPVDWVAVNPWDSAVPTLRLIQPNLFVKGHEYESNPEQVNPRFLEEAQAIGEVGGKVAFTYELTASSTAALKKLLGKVSP